MERNRNIELGVNKFGDALSEAREGYSVNVVIIAIGRGPPRRRSRMFDNQDSQGVEALAFASDRSIRGMG
jgi:hypothetical protein